MLLMYSILNWFSGLANGTGGIKVLIADTIVYRTEEKQEKRSGIWQVVYKKTGCSFMSILKTTHHYGILHVFPNILNFLFLFSAWGQKTESQPQEMTKHQSKWGDKTSLDCKCIHFQFTFTKLKNSILKIFISEAAFFSSLGLKVNISLLFHMEYIFNP